MQDGQGLPGDPPPASPLLPPTRPALGPQPPGPCTPCTCRSISTPSCLKVYPHSAPACFVSLLSTKGSAFPSLSSSFYCSISSKKAGLTWHPGPASIVVPGASQVLGHTCPREPWGRGKRHKRTPTACPGVQSLTVLAINFLSFSSL